MNARVSPWVRSVVHVAGCSKVRCGGECLRDIDGWGSDVRIMRPDGSIFRERRRVPLDNATKAEALSWARAREAYWIGRGLPFEGESRITVRELSRDWLKEKKGTGQSSYPVAETHLRLYVLPELGDMQIRKVRPRHVKSLLEKLKTTHSKRGGTLAPRTIRYVYFMLKYMFQWACQEELLRVNPIIVSGKWLPKERDKDPQWRRTARFVVGEVHDLVFSTSLDFRRRVSNALEFMTGTRPGEASALRWKDWEWERAPLGGLVCGEAYSTALQRRKPTKTEVVREIPVHPLLASMLSEWRAEGWRQWTGRDPTDEDLILPLVDGSHRPSDVALAEFHNDLKRLGLRRRRHYDTRRSFVSILRDAGAKKEDIRLITSLLYEESIDFYDTPTWQRLCDVVLLLPFALPLEDSEAPVVAAAT